MKIAAVGIGAFLLGTTVGVLGVATAAGHWLKSRGRRP